LRDFDNVLVTGGAGFIGSHLVTELLKNNFKLRVLDNLSTGSLENIKSHISNPNFHFINGDLRDRKTLNEALKDVKVVYHLAAISSVPFSIENPEETFQINVDGTRNLLELSAHNDVERFIFASSSAVYGDPIYLPIDEKHPENPKSPYALSKLEAEQKCMELEEKYGLKVVILRLFNVYGPSHKYNDYSGVITQFINRLRNNRPLLIYGDGTQTRDFVYVNDAAQAFIAALNGRFVYEGVPIFNIGTGNPTSINELARILMDLIGKETKVEYLSAREGDVKHSYADIKKAERILGYKPKYSLKDGLAILLKS